MSGGSKFCVLRPTHSAPSPHVSQENEEKSIELVSIDATRVPLLAVPCVLEVVFLLRFVWRLFSEYFAFGWGGLTSKESTTRKDAFCSTTTGWDSFRGICFVWAGRGSRYVLPGHMRWFTIRNEGLWKGNVGPSYKLCQLRSVLSQVLSTLLSGSSADSSGSWL